MEGLLDRLTDWRMLAVGFDALNSWLKRCTAAWHTDALMGKQTPLTPALRNAHVRSCTEFGMSSVSLFLFFFIYLAPPCLEHSLIFWDAYIFSRGLPEGTHGVNNETPCKHTDTFPSSATPNTTPPLACLCFSWPSPLVLLLLVFHSLKSFLPLSFLIICSAPFPPHVLAFRPF